MILAVRSEYLKGIFENLKRNTILFSRSVKEWIHSFPKAVKNMAVYRLLAIVKEGSSEERFTAVKGLLSLQDDSILPKLLLYAEDFSSPDKKRFLQLLEQSRFLTHPHTLGILQKWLREEKDPALRGMVQFFLAEQGLLSPAQILSRGRCEHYLSQAAAIASMKKAAAHLPALDETETRTNAFMGLQRFLSSENEDEVCIGLRLVTIDAAPSDVDILIPFLRHDSVKVARVAAEGIFAIIDKTCHRQAGVLVERLRDVSDSTVRIYCLRSLGKMGDSSYGRAMILQSAHFRPIERRMVEKLVVTMGLKTVPMLLAIVKEESINDRCRLLAGRILGRLALPQLRANLQPIINEAIDRAYFYFFHAHHLPEENPDIDLTILVDALKTGYSSTIDFIIQLLAVAGEVEDEELLSRSLRSANPKVRSQAVEALEKTCDPSLFSKIAPLVETIPLEVKLKEYLLRDKKAWTLSEVLDRLDASPTQVDQIIASTFKYRLDLPGWRESLRKKMSSQEEIFHHFAYELLEE